MRERERERGREVWEAAKRTRRKTGGSSTRCGLTLRAWSGHIIIRSILNRVWLDDASFPSSSSSSSSFSPLPNTLPIASPSTFPVNRPTSTVSRTILRGSLNRQQFQPLNNSWRSNLTANKLDRISRDLERAPKPRSLSLSLSIHLSIHLPPPLPPLVRREPRQPCPTVTNQPLNPAAARCRIIFIRAIVPYFPSP